MGGLNDYHETIGFFSQGVHSFAESEKEFTEKTHQFTTFMDEKILLQTKENRKNEIFDSDFIKNMTKEVDEMDCFIASL